MGTEAEEDVTEEDGADMVAMDMDSIHSLDKVQELMVKLKLLMLPRVPKVKDAKDRTLLVHSCKECLVASMEAIMVASIAPERTPGERRKPDSFHLHRRLKLDPQVISSLPTLRSATTWHGLGSHRLH